MRLLRPFVFVLVLAAVIGAAIRLGGYVAIGLLFVLGTAIAIGVATAVVYTAVAILGGAAARVTRRLLA